MSFTDDFNRADSATVGNGWTELASALSSISSNTLLFVGGGAFHNNVCYAPASADFADGTTYVDFNMSVLGLPQLHFRYDAGSRSGYVAYWSNSSNTFYLARNNSGSLATLDSGAVTLNTGVNYRITVTLSGLVKTAVLRNLDTATDLVTLTESVDSTYTTSGSIGVSIHTAGSINYDNFSSVEALPTNITLTDAFHNGSSLLSSKTAITAYVLNPSNGSLVATVTGLTTDANGLLDPIIDAALTDSTAYWVIVKFVSGELGFVRNAST